MVVFGDGMDHFLLLMCVGVCTSLVLCFIHQING